MHYLVRRLLTGCSGIDQWWTGVDRSPDSTTPAAREGHAGGEARRVRQPMNSLSSLSSAALGLAPTICFTSSPFRKTLSVGMPVTR
jgi:hypothetical protein